jgi:hypothetical protein
MTGMTDKDFADSMKNAAESERLRQIAKLKRELKKLLRDGECVYLETKPVQGKLRRV